MYTGNMPRVVTFLLLVVAFTVSGCATKKVYPGPELPRDEVGKALFNGMGTCFACHGRNGDPAQIRDSYRSIVGKLNPRPPSLRQSKSVAEKSDAELFRIIKYGSPGTAMVPMKHLDDAQIWDVIAYLRVLNRYLFLPLPS